MSTLWSSISSIRFRTRALKSFWNPNLSGERTGGFRIFDRQQVYFLNVPAEFLAEGDAAAIRDYLHRWDVAQLLRDAEAKQVTVLRGEPPIKAEDFPGETAT